MNWKITEQNFNLGNNGPGRIVVDLHGDISLSILTPARNEYLRDMKAGSILGGTWEITDVQADEGNYEVGICDSHHGEFLGVRLDPEPEDWASHAADIDGWIYTNLTAEQIEAVVNERGVGA